MKDWKLRSQLYHAMFPDSGDSLSNEIIIEDYDKDKIVEHAIQYPAIQTAELYYPAKSYAIAFTYAVLLVKEFGGLFLDYLDDPMLLAGNDPYFVRYSDDEATYQRIFSSFPYELLLYPQDASENFQKTIGYFYKEMLLADDTKQYAPVE